MSFDSSVLYPNAEERLMRLKDNLLLIDDSARRMLSDFQNLQDRFLRQGQSLKEIEERLRELESYADSLLKSSESLKRACSGWKTAALVAIPLAVGGLGLSGTLLYLLARKDE